MSAYINGAERIADEATNRMERANAHAVDAQRYEGISEWDEPIVSEFHVHDELQYPFDTAASMAHPGDRYRW